MTKDQIRKKQKLQRNLLSTEEQKIYSCAIRERLFQSDIYRDCSCLFTFLSFQSEVDTWDIIRQAIVEHKRVFIPRVEEQGIEFYEINNLESLVPSKFGIMEPLGLSEKREIVRKESTDSINTNQRRLMLLPGLAFDSKGNRIGYGAGYYDRYLSIYANEHFYKIALAYDFQVMEQITSEEFDIKADAIITPSQMILCR